MQKPAQETYSQHFSDDKFGNKAHPAMAADSRSRLSLDELTRLGGCGCCAAAQAIPLVISAITSCIWVSLCDYTDAQVLTFMIHATKTSAIEIGTESSVVHWDCAARGKPETAACCWDWRGGAAFTKPADGLGSGPAGPAACAAAKAELYLSGSWMGGMLCCVWLLPAIPGSESKRLKVALLAGAKS